MPGPAPPNYTSATIPEKQEVDEKTDWALEQSPDQWDWSFKARMHGRFNQFKAAWPLTRFSNLIWKICLPIRAMMYGVEGSVQQSSSHTNTNTHTHTHTHTQTHREDIKND